MNHMKSTFILLFAVFILSIVPSIDASSSVTIEQILSVPFPSELTASPSGKRFAWVSNREGVRNIWVAEGPAYNCASQIIIRTETIEVSVLAIQAHLVPNSLSIRIERSRMNNRQSINCGVHG